MVKSLTISVLLTRQEHFTAASDFLFIITKRRAFFRHITILVPSVWTGVYDDAGTEDYSAANIVLHSDGSKFTPYTRQYEGCGVGGEQMFLLSPYIKTKTTELMGIVADLPHGK